MLLHFPPFYCLHFIQDNVDNNVNGWPANPKLWGGPAMQAATVNAVKYAALKIHIYQISPCVYIGETWYLSLSMCLWPHGQSKIK